MPVGDIRSHTVQHLLNDGKHRPQQPSGTIRRVVTEDDSYQQAMAEVTRAHARAVAAVTAKPGVEAFTLATQLRDQMEALADADAVLRAEIAARIAEEEQLSLAGLADRISVSKARADQMVRRARSQDPGGTV